jgi:hypothetical protein
MLAFSIFLRKPYIVSIPDFHRDRSVTESLRSALPLACKNLGYSNALKSNIYSEECGTNDLLEIRIFKSME